MNNYNNKKTATSLILISVSLIILLTLIKQDVRRYYKPVQIFRLFGEEYSYNNTLFALFLIIIASILLFIYSDDNQIKAFWITSINSLKKRYDNMWYKDDSNDKQSGTQSLNINDFKNEFKGGFFKSMYEHHTIINGRNSRLKFLGNQIFNSLGSLIFFWAIISLSDILKFEGKVISFVIGWIVTFILFHYRNWAKRFQDFGVNGKVALIGGIPYLGLIIFPLLLLVPGSEFPNKYGRQDEI